MELMLHCPHLRTSSHARARQMWDAAWITANELREASPNAAPLALTVVNFPHFQTLPACNGFGGGWWKSTVGRLRF